MSTQSQDSNKQGASSLIKMFLSERNHGKDGNRQLQSFQREPLLLEFCDLVHKITKLDQEEEFNLKHVMEDIKSLGLHILGLENHDTVCSTIVTEAVEIHKKQDSNAPKKTTGLVKVDPKPKSSIQQELIDWAVKKAVKHLYPNPEACHSMFLEYGFAPIKKETLPISNLRIVGQIPLELNGMMVRNGPNPLHDPDAKYAWLDGDSMIHAIRFQKGKATYVSRYVETSCYKQEKFFGKSEFLKYGDLEGPFGLLMASVQLLKAKFGIVDMSYGWLNGNTGVVYHGGMIMALQDWDTPYVINISKDGDLATLGTFNYEK